MKIFFSLLALLLAFSFEATAKDARNDSGYVAITVSSNSEDTEDELNAAQLFEKQMMEKRLQKKKNKKSKKYSGSRGGRRKGSSAPRSSGSNNPRGLPSVSNGMFVK